MATALTIAGQGSPDAYAMRVDQALAGITPQFEGAYVHVPFCFHKCHYCDFYSFVDREDRQDAYAARVDAELAAMAPWVHAPLHTVFVGGGTPTLLRPPVLRTVLGSIRSRLPLAAGAEWTVEANPETVTAEVADALVESGVNRVSLGAQSFNERHLKTLERWHDPASVARAIGFLRAAGIGRINVDLIFGIPGGTLAEWESDLRSALDLGTDHLSCYGLTYEANTAMTVRMERGEFEPCDDGLEASMLERAADVLREAGFAHYEVSNWGRVRAGDPHAEECRHNLLYWRNRDWLAIGPSASGHAQGVRWKNVPRLGDWLAAEGASPAVDVERVTPDMRAGERLMMGLRLHAGVPEGELAEILQLGERGAERARAIADAVAEGMMEHRDGALRFTARGMMVANTVLARLV
ncbi:MAG: radical SAM family heme chaperone HemW [Planctomycetota bacterium]|nr:radical SAM family heme chaperone HemW [Planctomycetota bacterium]RLS46005.1 MAG: radical SAM family heme chaperone HemW [Planctomycetota bacterium]